MKQQITTSKASKRQESGFWSDVSQLVKLRLSVTVVLSSVLAYLIALDAGAAGISWWALFVLIAGGLLTAGAANALNEVLEKDYDKMMARTSGRPLATGQWSTSDGVMAAGFMTLVGVTLLALFNPWTAFLGTFSLVSYAFVYTPMKRVSPAAVFVGAVPGALPALIGCTAAQGYISWLGFTLFVIQFFWQLPHFYAIGYLGYDDYKRAGFKLVLERDGKVDGTRLGRDAFWAAVSLIPLAFIPYLLDFSSLSAAFGVAVIGALFSVVAFDFWQKPERKTALRTMFASFLYIPLVFSTYWVDQLL
ncbi:MAG: heme o synthase [Bacteroidota bacterium]